MPAQTPRQRRSTQRLGKPTAARRGQGYEATVGDVSEAIARLLGTGRFLVFQTGIVIVWIAINVAAGADGLWDKFPFELLNLAFSTQSAYAAPLILLAQNRQQDHDKHEIQRDREAKARAVAETEFLAREMADLRLTLETKLDRADFDEGGPVGQAIERLREAIGVPEDPEPEMP